MRLDGPGLRVVVAGMVAGVPGHGGATWAVLQWALGLGRLGCEVVVVEPAARADRAAADYLGVVRDGEPGLRAALLTPGGTVGMPAEVLRDYCSGADVLLNVAGMLRDEALTGAIPVRAYLDLDPAFTQLWQSADGIDMHLDGHTHFVTVGLNLGRPGCELPTCGRRWLTTLPPVVLARWPVARHDRTPAFTTVASWRGYGSVVHRGVQYGQKAHSWRRLLDLPARGPAPLLPALAIDPGEEKDVAALEEHGWQWVSPAEVAGDPRAYQAFVSGSLGELGVAKSGYVVSACGWFSDRSACYLAAGRPVVAQETGWSGHLPTGPGLAPFSTADQAAAAMEAVLADPPAAREHARSVAESHLDSDRVIGRLLGLLTGGQV